MVIDVHEEDIGGLYKGMTRVVFDSYVKIAVFVSLIHEHSQLTTLLFYLFIVSFIEFTELGQCI